MKYSTDFVFLYYVSIFLVFLFVSFVVGLLILLIANKVLSKKVPISSKPRLKVKQAMLFGIVITGLTAIFCFVIPTLIKDNNWRTRQMKCAKEAGYSDPGDNNSNKATAESQSVYSNCLNR